MKTNKKPCFSESKKNGDLIFLEGYTLLIWKNKISYAIEDGLIT